MTTPGESAGDAFIAFHADTKPMVREVQEGLAEVEVLATVEGDAIGHSLGEHIGEGVKKEVKDQGPSIARDIEQAISRETIRPKPRFSLRGLFGGNRGRSQSKVIASDIEHVVEDAVGSVAKPGGPIDTIGKTIGQTLGDGIGSVFNVSGKSPLIALLIPVFAELGVLIGGLVQALGPLLGLLTTLPAVIGGIALSVGVLFLAFHGLGGAIQGAFAATNAKELNAALKDLMPAAKSFVMELLSVRDIFKQLSQDAQQAFFAPLVGKLSGIVRDLSILFHGDLESLAGALGAMFAELADFLDSPSMKIFLTELFPATEKWLAGFGTGLVSLLTGLIDLATASLPFLSTVGADLNSVFGDLGQFLTKLAKDPKFKKWLDSMLVTFDSLLGVFKAAGVFIAVFLDSLDKAGGEQFLQTLVDQLMLLTAFFASDVGIHALKGFIGILIFLGDAFVGLVIIIAFIEASLEEFFEWLLNIALPAVGEFLQMIGKSVVDFLSFVGEKMREGIFWLGNQIKDGFNAVVDWFKALPGVIGGFFSDATSWLWNAGKDIVTGLWNGIKASGAWLKEKVLQWARDHIPGPIRDALGIHSPSKVTEELGRQTAKGFSIGFDDEFQKNAATIRASLGGITTDVSTSTSNSNIGFGPGAIQITFAGQLPTAEQATAVGAAVGSGIESQLAARNARLAVRTM